VGILERNRAVAQRLSRVVACASGFLDVACEDDPASLRKALAVDPFLLACDAADIDLALEWSTARYPSMRLLVWAHEIDEHLLELARQHPRVVSILGWPSFASTPRPWELAYAVRRALEPYAQPPRLADFLMWGATVLKWRPRTSGDRDHIVTEVAQAAERAGAPARTAERLSEVAHELLMNAMYDAPVDENGALRYSHDRKQEISLLDDELPTFRIASDGAHMGLQVVDPFGRLRRRAVYGGIVRGLSAAASTRDAAQILDTSAGGAGLGMFKIYSSSASVMVDVEPSQFSMVTAIFDLQVNPRELRTMPVSLHVFDRGDDTT
jgi:hypothetical protein